ncbi:LacI family DNA-binding transcriptional regulator [Spelaeicoccus albus]|uniref:LacI family transcriptional regulator n=1 Tax=Spelaeicoccus albus TaxID=1280376 RepID=A0A7Z0IH34_9MICO|nr:LacI family DNA-binding transcriptional regulator [Spelaeicoccus albus]NYI67474.1 LacI family transcriptional regulator [Spelaeicoccus albus]
MTKPKSSPTISDVATAAGVGRATVARSLGGYGSVSEKTRANVLAAAQRIGYRPNTLAKSMKTRTTHTIGVVLADIGNPFFTDVLRGVSSVVREARYDLLLSTSDEDTDKEAASIDVLLNKLVDGIILAPVAGKAEPLRHLESLLEREVPLVMVDRKLNALDADAIVINNREASYAAVQEFIRHGHKRIGFVWGPTTNRPAADASEMRAIIERSISSEGGRLLGYMDALDDAGIEFDTSLVTHVHNDEHQAIRAVNGMMALSDPPTAILATETEALTGSLHAMQQRGLECPRDVSLIGFDDSAWASIMQPPMSIVAQPTFELGRLAARRLIERIDGDASPTRDYVLEATFVPRESVTTTDHVNS